MDEPTKNPYLIWELVDLDLNILRLVYRGEKLFNYILDLVYELNYFYFDFNFFLIETRVRSHKEKRGYYVILSMVRIYGK